MSIAKFLAGLLAGGAAFAALLVSVTAVDSWRSERASESRRTFQQDGGGRRVEFKQGRLAAQLACRGACDTLQIRRGAQ